MKGGGEGAEGRVRGGWEVKMSVGYMCGKEVNVLCANCVCMGGYVCVGGWGGK